MQNDQTWGCNCKMMFAGIKSKDKAERSNILLKFGCRYGLDIKKVSRHTIRKTLKLMSPHASASCRTFAFVTLLMQWNDKPFMKAPLTQGAQDGTCARGKSDIASYFAVVFLLYCAMQLRAAPTLAPLCARTRESVFI